MISAPSTAKARQTKSRSRRPMGLQDVLQSLGLVLEMEPDHLDGAIDLLDEAIHLDRQKSFRKPAIETH